MHPRALPSSTAFPLVSLRPVGVYRLLSRLLALRCHLPPPRAPTCCRCAKPSAGGATRAPSSPIGVYCLFTHLLAPGRHRPSLLAPACALSSPSAPSRSFALAAGQTEREARHLAPSSPTVICCPRVLARPDGVYRLVSRLLASRRHPALPCARSRRSTPPPQLFEPDRSFNAQMPLVERRGSFPPSPLKPDCFPFPHP